MAKQDGFAEDPLTPHYAGHRDRLRQRFRHNGGEALADYDYLKCFCFAPSREPTPNP